ncbi:hypothetical protein [Actinoplanes sp. CA-252034]|uniref:hypothetical protein n=1 Tax=Actinoplanes sp. CA-252034 TaxID=3239906 RepID=UPI003D98C76D
MPHEDILALVDWSAVEHAYARSADVRKTPEILKALLSEEAALQAEALGDLYGVVHHQDTIYSATPPAVRYVVEILDDPRTLTPVPRGFDSPGEEPLRAALLNWLTSVMEAAAESARGELSGEPVDVEACRAARGQVYLAAHGMLADPDSAVVSASLGTIACVLDAPELQHFRSPVAAWLNNHAMSLSDRRIRVLAALMLSCWGHDSTTALRDPDRVVRAAAALSPAHATDPEATSALLEVLASPADAAWCQQVFPHFGRIFPFKLLPTAIDRSALDELLRHSKRFWRLRLKAPMPATGGRVCARKHSRTACRFPRRSARTSAPFWTCWRSTASDRQRHRSGSPPTLGWHSASWHHTAAPAFAERPTCSAHATRQISTLLRLTQPHGRSKR